jgi:hypothetical protein
MASNLPPVVAGALAQPTTATVRKSPPVDVKREGKPQPRQLKDTILIEIPIGEYDSRYPNARVDVHLDLLRAIKMRALLRGLQREKEQLNNGNGIKTNADVVRWLLDQVEDSSVGPSERIK